MYGLYRHFLLPAALVLIGVATLTPVEGLLPNGFSVCLTCGHTATADLVRNILLFLPLGLALGGHLPDRRRAVLLGLAVSLTVESLQLMIPGRDPSLRDLACNALGTYLGARLVHSASNWLLPLPRQARSLTTIALGLIAGTLALGGYLLQPSLPGEALHGQWTPELRHLEYYRGRVLDVHLGEVAVHSGRLEDAAGVRELLRAGAALEIDAIAGPPPIGLAPIFSISTSRRREVLLLGAEQDDVVYRYRTRAIRARLQSPELRAAGVLRGIKPGESLRIIITRSGKGHCIEINESRRCGLGLSVADLGSLLIHFRSISPRFQRLLGLGLLAALFLPSGFWLRAPRGSAWPDISAALVTAATIGGMLAVIPALVGLLPATMAEYLAAYTGFGVGLGFGGWYQWVCSGTRSGVRGVTSSGKSVAARPSRQRSMRV